MILTLLGGHSVEVAHRSRAEHRGEEGGEWRVDRRLPQLRREGGRGAAAVRVRRLLEEAGSGKTSNKQCLIFKTSN